MSKTVLHLNLVLWMVLTGTFLFFSSCQPMGQRTSLEKVDSLKQMLDEAGETLAVDEEKIRDRQDSIQIKLEYIRSNIREMTREQQSILTDYRAVGRVYRGYLQKEEGVLYDHNKHRERIENLKKDVRAGRIDEKEMEDIFNEEKKVLEQHRFDVKELINPVVEVEQMYQRTHGQVRDIYLDVMSEQRARR